MRIRTLGLAALMGGSLTGDGVAQSLQNEIQNEEPRARNPDEYRGRQGRNRSRVEHDSVASRDRRPDLAAPDDPDKPYAEDTVDADLPGEGPEDLSGPDDDDALPD
jgi:hypothetical protein